MAKSKKTTKKPTYSSIEDISKRNTTKYTQERQGTTGTNKPGVMFNTVTGNDYVRRISEQNQRIREESERRERERQEQARRNYASMQAGNKLFTSLDELRSKNEARKNNLIRGIENLSGQKFTGREKFEINKRLVTGKEPAPMVPDNAAVAVDQRGMLDAFLKQRAQKAKEYKAQRDSTYLGVKDNRQANNTGYSFNVNDYIGIQQQKLKNRDQKLLDSGTDPRSMSDEGLANYKTGFQKKYDTAMADIAEMNRQKNLRDGYIPWLGWGNQVYDYIHDLGIQNEDTILNGEGYNEEEKRNAWWKKTELQDRYQSGRDEALEDARIFYNNEYVGGGFAGTEYDRQNMRELAYEQIMGEKYADRVARMTPEQKAELDSRIDQAIGGFTNPYDTGRDYDAEMQSRKKEADAYLQQVRTAEDLEAERGRMANFAQQAAQMGISGEYREDLQPEVRHYVSDMTDDMPEPQGSEADKAYFWANNYQDYPDLIRSYDQTNKYMFIRALGDDVLDQFNTFYAFDKENGTRAAEGFLQGLEPALSTCLAEYRDWYMRTKAEDPVSGIPARILSPAMNTVSGIAGMTGTALAALGVESAKDRNSGWYMGTRAVSTLRSQQNEDAGEWIARITGSESAGQTAERLLGVIDSISDNMFSMGVGTMFGGEGTKKAMRLVQLIMSGEATSNRMVELLDKNMDPTEAALYAVGDGVIEWITEKYSLEQIMGPDVKQLLGNKKALASFIARSAGAEGSEEVASDLLNTVLDSVLSRIYDHETEIEQRYNELIASGMSDRQAWQQALKEKMEETGWSFLGGALSGGLMAGGRVVMNLSNQSRTGKQARTNGGAKQLYDMAMNMGEDTNSRQLASQIQLTEEGEIQAKDYEIGRLAQALMSETGDQYNKTVRGTVEKDIKEKLNAAGIYRNADEYAKIIADSMTGDGKMSARSKRTLAKDARAIEVWKKYNMPGEYADNLNSRIREATKAETAAQKSVAEAVTGRKIRSYEGGINLAGFDEIREAERNGAKRTGGKREVLINGQFAKLDSVRVVKEGDSWKLKLSVNGKDVNASDLQATDYGTAQIIRNAAVMPEFYGERFTNQMLEAQEKGRLKSDNILDDLQEAGMVRLAGYAGIAMPQTTLDRQLAGEIWAESLKEHAENRKAQVAGANRKESGTVSFDGDEYGTEAYNKKVSRLDGETRAKLDYVAGIAQRAGVDARFTDLSKTDTTTYGWENKKGIGINIGGLNYGTIEGKSTPTGKHDIVVTFGHELTHWLQRNSLAGYNRLEQYIMNQFAQQRGLKGLRQRLDYFMTQEGLSLEDAMSEVVANGSDQILGDEQVAEHIQQTDGKLYTQIKNFVQNLVDRMKKAITGTSMQDSMSRDARVIMARGINDLRKRWMGAWDEALSGVAKETTEQHPVGQLDRDYQKAIEDGNEEEQKRLVEEAARQAGYTEKVYHGTTKYGFTVFDMNKEGKGAIFTSYNFGQAQTYTRDADVRYINEEQDRTDGVYKLFAKPGKQLVINARRSPWSGINLEKSGILEDIRKYINETDAETHKGLFFDEPWNNGEDVHFTTNEIAAYAKAAGYDSVRIKNVFDEGGLNGKSLMALGDVGIFFNENDVKSADPVTYDGHGNVIPLSKRFNDQKNDIRWSVAEQSAEKYKDVDMANDRHIYDYDFLTALPDIRIVTASNRSAFATKNGKNYDLLAEQAKENALKYGTEIDNNRGVSVKNVYTGRDIIITTQGALHSTHYLNNTVNIANAKASEKIGELVKYAVPINALNEKEGDRNTIGSYAMAAPMISEDGTKKRVAVITVDIRTGDVLDVETYEQVHSASARKMNEVGVDTQKVSPPAVPETGRHRTTRSTMTISEFLQEVNSTHRGLLSQNVLDVFNEKKPEKGYWPERSKFSKAEQKNNEGASGSSMVDAIDNMEQAVTPSAQSIYDIDDTVKKDREYEAAVERGDIERATEMLMDKLRSTKGVIPFMAMEWDAGENRKIAKALKTGDPEAIAAAAEKMSRHVPENAVLIPMPGRSGKVVSDSWTVKLANAIGEKTGRPVVIALEGEEHESRQEAKHRGEKGVGREDLGFRQVAEIPEGTFPIFIDNVVGSGVTADAAREAMGGGITLAYTKSLRSPGLPGLKNAVVTYESQSNGGGLIPLSERFNVSKRDVRYSRAEEALDAGVWMANLTPSAVQTEDERVLMQAYKDKRISISLCLKRQIDYKAKIRELESKESLTGEQRTELENLQDKLEKQQERMAQLEKEMQQITSSEGYAGMMYRYNMVLKDFVQGRTSEQVRDTVEAMLNEVKAAQEQITRRAEELKNLEQTQAVKAMKSFMGKTSLGQQASMLRKQYNSTMNKAEVEDRLAAMALKLASGQDIQTDAEALAADLVDKIRGIRSENLESLRGMTLNIGESLRNELKAENSSMKEIRGAIYGSGLMIKAEGNSRLTEQWNELRENNKALPDIDGMAEIDALHTIVDFISGELQASRGSEQYNVNMEEATAICYGAAASVTTYLVKDPAARKQITELMTQIKDLSRRTGSIAESMDQLNEKMQEVVKAGYKAADWTSILQNDVHTAIDYYNKVARQAAQEEKAQVKKNLIEQLRSENARKLYEQQDKYEELIKKNRQARELSEDNQALRKKINTNLSRLKKRLMEETDQKNIPEETKALARQLLGKIVSHDMTDGLRRLTFADKDQLQDMSDRLARMTAQDGAFDPERDLDWLVIKAPNPEDNDTSMRDKIIADLRHIDNGLLMYWTAEGNGVNSLQNRKEALDEIQKAVAEITGVIQARGRAFINGKRYEVADLAERMEDEMSRSRFKGERTGTGSRQMNAVERALKYGNLTPEYFFKNLKNSVMTLLHGGFHDAENRSGLLAGEAQEKIQKIADDTGFNTWDGQEKHQVKVSGGRTVEMTTEQIMALYATWMRERNNVRPEDTAHLLKGGFVLAPKENTTGKPGREKTQQRPIRITKDQLIKLHDYLTTEQRDYVERIVEYMSTDLAEIGNEASMEAYGIRKFTEKYYFPIKSWGGVLNQDSARGITNQNDNRAMRQSFTKRITAGASNAIEISDFTPTAMKHVVGMITFNTVGPAVENLNKVLNQQLQYGDVTYFEDGDIDEDNRYKRSVRAAFQEAYGKNAADYLAQFMKDVNGGVTQQAENSLREKLLSLFKKNAVAGSLSVAAQQPLSYIRAAMMINPKYLAQALSPQYWRGSLAEMRKYSGVAMLKHMGKFDMNYGRSMIDYITPKGKQTSKAKAVYDLVSEKSTALPEKMDDMTWTRMWTAVKLEQAAMHPGADITSDAFLKQVAERFNELMRRTQVYDSVLVKSQNMRSNSYLKKVTTSFMGEPTLTLNVLADAWQNRKEAGGKKMAIKALVTFVLSAAAQAGAKGLFGAGRSPDKKKNQEENFYNRFAMNLISEMNPLGLIPGYNQMMDVLMKGELNDDAMGVIGKAKQAFDAIFELATGNIGDRGLYRKLEDSIGQTVQYATNIPLKNFMRDFRAMVNWFSGGNAKGLTGDMFAQRPTSAAVMKYQTLDALVSDDIIGLINQKLGDAGYKTDTADYKARIYQAEAAGDKKRAEELTEYLTLGKGVSQKKLDEYLNANAKQDESLTAEKRLSMLEEHGYGSMSSQVLEEYRSGNLKRAEAEKRYRKERPNAKDKDVLEALDKIDYEKRTGKKIDKYSNYTPVYDAMEANKADQIREAIRYMLDHGYEVKDVKAQINKTMKEQYAEADSREKVRLVDAMEKAYKVLGLTAADADKVIDGWKKEKKTTK